jgi:hypothetical protein
MIIKNLLETYHANLTGTKIEVLTMSEKKIDFDKDGVSKAIATNTRLYWKKMMNQQQNPNTLV